MNVSDVAYKFLESLPKGMTAGERQKKIINKAKSAKERCLECCGRNIAKALICGDVKCPSHKGHQYWTSTSIKSCCK